MRVDPSIMKQNLIQVCAPRFTAGIVFNTHDEVVLADPILNWTIGKQRDFLYDYFRKKGWRIVPACPLKDIPMTKEDKDAC